MAPGNRIPFRLVKTGGKMRKGFSTSKQGPEAWGGNVDWKTRPMGVRSKQQGYIPIYNRVPLLIVPELEGFKLKPYLSPHGEKVENYATSHHDVLVVMQAEGYVPPEQRVKMPDMEDGDKLGFPKKKTLEQQKDEATKAMPMSIYENEVARCKHLNTPFRER
ncbi:uncharacterized protein LOC135829422 [Sycon ciliatum]|uniref:uncharacterized protein LOC135829422 n=1 Tax=Sycon ciliatum TaxID=27933 RepID=UPI0031F6A328